MVSEESPLLASTVHEAIYDRFVPDQKRWIVFHVSFVGLLSIFVQATFVPSIPQIAKDLDSTHAAVSLSILASAIGALVWTAYPSFYGRQSIYLWGMPFLCVGSCGVALSTSLQSLLFWRFVQTFGCAGALPLGTGVIGDIYKLEERGTVIGVFFGVILLGHVVAPFLGGAATKYWSWRNLHYCLGAWGLVGMVLVYLSLPETSHPGALGIDKVTRRRWIHITWVNPLSSLWLLRSPNLFAVMLASALMINTAYVLLVPMAYTIGIRYGITSEAIIGACFLPNGLGGFSRCRALYSQSANTIFHSRCFGCWPTIRYCSQKVAEETQRSVVSRRPLESNVDRRAYHGPVIYWGIGADHDVDWGPDRSCAEYIVHLCEWSGGRISIESY
jgi:MFS family permease